jgi:hypothetical protein
MFVRGTDAWIITSAAMYAIGLL